MDALVCLHSTTVLVHDTLKPICLEVFTHKPGLGEGLRWRNNRFINLSAEKSAFTLIDAERHVYLI
jgi:hypothetical protein